MQNASIKELRRLLTQEEDLSVVYNYFFDWIDENPSAVNHPAPKNKALEAMLKICLIQTYESAVSISNVIMHDIKDLHLIHGLGHVNGRHLMVFFYFSDLDRGMASCMLPDGQTGFVRFRFSTTYMPDFDLSKQQN